LSHFRFLAALLALSMTAGCKAQPAPSDAASQKALDPATLNRRIETMVRSQFNVPQDYSVTLGARKPSSVSGYDTLPITLTRGDKKTDVNFLISSDGKTLARLETYDLAKDPAFNIDIADRPIRGNPDAKVTVVNFDDLECPYCARMHQALFPATFDRYKDKVRFIYKDDPLTDMHPWAMHASVDANCLAAQKGEVYWNYVDYLHAHGDEINGADRDLTKSFAALDRIARDEAMLGKLDSAKVDACIAKQDETQIKASTKEADELKIDGTPALFVDGERIDGAVPEEQVWLAIDRALRAAGVEPPPPAAKPAQPAGNGK
jgi:protein-disulfide isomerase